MAQTQERCFSYKSIQKVILHFYINTFSNYNHVKSAFLLFPLTPPQKHVCMSSLTTPKLIIRKQAASKRFLGIILIRSLLEHVPMNYTLQFSDSTGDMLLLKTQHL